MQDIGKILIGIVVFLALFSLPVIITQASGNSGIDSVPDLADPDMTAINAFVAAEYPTMTYDGECVESTDYMRKNHMDLLMNWKANVVRDDADSDTGLTTYTASDGDVWNMSLNDTCLGCHGNRDIFCQKCHDFTPVKPSPFCWDCHD